MASPALSVIEQIARDYSGDDDSNSANWSVKEPEQLRIVNRFYLLHKRITDAWTQDLTPATSGLTVPAGTNTIYTTMTTIANIEDMFLGNAVGTNVRTSEALERCENSELDEWTVDYTTQGVVARWFARRLGDMNKNAGSVGLWEVRVHPTPVAQTFLVARCVIEPIPLVAQTDVPDLTYEEGMGLAVMVGAWQAERVGNEHLVPSILAELPAQMQATLVAAHQQSTPQRGKAA
jgi:hypothetical protein